MSKKYEKDNKPQEKAINEEPKAEVAKKEDPVKENTKEDSAPIKKNGGCAI